MLSIKIHYACFINMMTCEEYQEANLLHSSVIFQFSECLVNTKFVFYSILLHIIQKIQRVFSDSFIWLNLC